MANTIGWGKGTQNNTNGWGKYQNTIDAGSVYADSYAGETVLVGTSAAFSYSKSSFHQDEADPTPTITGTAGGTFSATPSGLSINSSTGTIDLDNSTIQSYTITYTVSGVSAQQSLAVTASPFVVNNFSMQFDGINDQVITTDSIISGNGIRSISLWYKTSSSAAQIPFSLGGPTDSTNGSQFAYCINRSSTTNAAIFGKTSPYDTSVFTVPNTSDGNWHHLVVTYDQSTLKVYIDGNLEATPSLPSSTYNTSAGLSISGWSIAGNRLFDGNIDEVAIWNATLSSDAVTEIYNATANNTGKVLDLNTDSGNYTSSANLQYWNRLGD